MLSRQRELFTFQFVKFDAALKPIESASGCVIRYEGELFLLTVAHAIKSAKDWYLALEVVDGRGWKNDPIAPMNYLRRLRVMSAKVHGHGLDFAYKELPSVPDAYHEWRDNNGALVSKKRRRVIDTDLRAVPDPAAAYSFWGAAYDAPIYPMFHLIPRSEDHLRFVLAKGDFLFFQRPTRYRSYADYKGCSGAPIMDDSGNLVALVVRGDRKNAGFWAFNLAKHRAVFDIAVMQRRAC